MRVQHDPQRVEEFLHPESIAARAGAGGIVEREQLRLERRHAVAAHRAGVAAGEHQLSLRILLRDRPGLAILARRSPLTRLTLARGLIEKREPREPAGQAQGGLERFRQALRGIGPDAHAVDHRLDGVFLLAVELRQRLHFVDAPVDAHAYEALRGEILQELEVLALALAHHRCEQRRGQAFRQPQRLVDHLAQGLEVGGARAAHANLLHCTINSTRARHSDPNLRNWRSRAARERGAEGPGPDLIYGLRASYTSRAVAMSSTASPRDLNTVVAVGAGRRVAANTSPASAKIGARDRITSPDSLSAASRESTIRQLPISASSSSSRQLGRQAPMALTCAPGFSHAPRRSGVRELVAVTTTSAPRTAASSSK